MSYEIIPFQPGVIPSYIRSEGPTELTKNLLKQTFNVKRISIRGKVFRLIIGGEEVAKNKQGYLDVIVVNGAPSYNRTYYEGAYDPRAEQAAAPRCWSNDSKVPAPDVQEPMHDNCRDCPMNIKGSGNGDSRACRIKQRIAVVLAVDPDSGVYLLEIPAASIFGKGQDNLLPWEAYVRYVASQQLGVDRLVTRITLDEDAETPRLLFTPVGYPPRELLSVLDEMGQSEDAKAAINISVYQVDTGAEPRGLPAPKVKAALPAPVDDEEDEEPAPRPKKVAKVVAPVDDEEDEEPAPRPKKVTVKGFESDDEDDAPAPTVRPVKAKTVAPTAKPDLNAILAKFGKSVPSTADSED
jgi:hypothetical protein